MPAPHTSTFCSSFDRVEGAAPEPASCRAEPHVHASSALPHSSQDGSDMQAACMCGVADQQINAPAEKEKTQSSHLGVIMLRPSHHLGRQVGGRAHHGLRSAVGIVLRTASDQHRET